RFIKTDHGRGYRFIGVLSASEARTGLYPSEAGVVQGETRSQSTPEGESAGERASAELVTPVPRPDLPPTEARDERAGRRAVKATPISPYVLGVSATGGACGGFLALVFYRGMLPLVIGQRHVCGVLPSPDMDAGNLALSLFAGAAGGGLLCRASVIAEGAV